VQKSFISNFTVVEKRGRPRKKALFSFNRKERGNGESKRERKLGGSAEGEKGCSFYKKGSTRPATGKRKVLPPEKISPRLRRGTIDFIPSFLFSYRKKEKN